jgi:hypothetical protein
MLAMREAEIRLLDDVKHTEAQLRDKGLYRQNPDVATPPRLV